MNVNDIFAYGSTVDVLLKIKSARTIDGVSYATNEPYTFLNNVRVSFEYNNASVNIHASQPLIGWKEDFPTTLIITGAPSSKKVSALLFKKVADSSVVSRYLNNTDLSGGELFLDVSAKDFFLYKDDVKDTGYTFDNVSGLFTITDYDVNKKYRLFYNETITKQGYSFESPNNAYFTIEIRGVGNKNGETMNVFMKLSSCALLAEKITNFDGAESNGVNLVFSIIKSNEPDYLVFE